MFSTRLHFVTRTFKSSSERVDECLGRKESDSVCSTRVRILYHHNACRSLRLLKLLPLLLCTSDGSVSSITAVGLPSDGRKVTYVRFWENDGYVTKHVNSFCVCPLFFFCFSLVRCFLFGFKSSLGTYIGVCIYV